MKAGRLNISTHNKSSPKTLKKRGLSVVLCVLAGSLSSPSLWHFTSRQEIYFTFLRLFSGHKPIIVPLAVNR